MCVLPNFFDLVRRVAYCVCERRPRARVSGARVHIDPSAFYYMCYVGSHLWNCFNNSVSRVSLAAALIKIVDEDDRARGAALVSLALISLISDLRLFDS
jgi:hypothetical protein